VVIIERLIPDPVKPTADAEEVVIFDIAMMAMFGADGGRERTLAEYDTLLRAAGLDRTQVTPLAAHFVAITASPREQRSTLSLMSLIRAPSSTEPVGTPTAP